MLVLVACEFSGVVRDAFTARGHFAMSCDLLPSETPGEHYQGDVRDCLDGGWDLMIAFPPCTYLANAGVRWWPQRREEQAEAIAFVQQLLAAPIPRIAVENPVGILSTAIRRPEQIVHPWQHGHPESKPTCLWLKNLPILHTTDIVGRAEKRIVAVGQRRDRWKIRSRTYDGIANAMASQWGALSVHSLPV